MHNLYSLYSYVAKLVLAHRENRQLSRVFCHLCLAGMSLLTVPFSCEPHLRYTVELPQKLLDKAVDARVGNHFP
ncbi:hypothetical protein DENSPDRAFT_485726 [Dentipellis sp. KUC8613]|nr:hypothetical protein DENSPDRAFT_485726 [Dentipellis sp. KUC8613]